MKKSSCLFVLSSLLLLTGCGGSVGNSSDVVPSSGSLSSGVASSGEDVSSSASSLNLLEQFSNFLTEKENNCYMTSDAGTKISFFSSDAVYYDYSSAYEEVGYEDFGYIRTPQGLFQYGLGDDGVELWTCGSVAKDLDVTHFCYYPQDIFTHTEVFQPTDYPEIFSCADSRILTPALALDGIDSTYVEDVTDFAVSLHQDKGVFDKAYVTWTLLGKEYSIVFQNFGTTKNEKVDAFLANPAEMKPLTDWPSAVKEDMQNILHEVVPFYPNSSYAVSYEADEEEGTHSFTDLACGDQLEAYGELLKQSGYAYSAENSEKYYQDDGQVGYRIDCYLKYVYKEGSSTIVDYVNLVKVSYVTGVYLDESYGYTDYYAKEYPLGEFDVSFASEEYYDDAKYNAKIKEVSAPFGDFGTIPDFVLAEEASMMYTDQSELGYYMEGYLAWHLFTADLSSSEMVDASLNPYVLALEEAGFVNKNGNKPGDYSNVLYKNAGGYALVIEVIHSDKNTKSFVLSVSIQYKIDTPVPLTWEEFDEKVAEMKKNCPKAQGLPESASRDGTVTLIDYTEAMKAEYEGAEAKEIYFSYYFTVTYEKEEDAKNTAYALSESFKMAHYVDDGTYNLDDDHEVGYAINVKNQYVLDVDIQYVDNKFIYSVTGYQPA